VLRVYHRDHAGRPVRVAWLLEELGEPYEVTVITSEEGKGEEHRARHPLGRVPVLEDDDGVLFESTAICLHLAEAHPDSGLLPPPGTRDRSIVHQWTIFAPAELEPRLIAAGTAMARDPETAPPLRARFRDAATAVSDALDGNDFIVGDRLTVADMFLSTALAFTARANLADELAPNLQEYVARMGRRPAFQRAVARTSD
jgi:glutathione S-transferase